MNTYTVHEFSLSSPAFYLSWANVQANSLRGAVSKVAKEHGGEGSGNTVRVVSKGIGFDVFLDRASR